VITNKIDLVMWINKGAKHCILLSDRICFFKSVIANKIILDDSSSDDVAQMRTVMVEQSISNYGKGIVVGTNTALKIINSEIFVNLKQDVLWAY
jgi:hypothetical protein